MCSQSIIALYRHFQPTLYNLLSKSPNATCGKTAPKAQPPCRFDQDTPLFSVEMSGRGNYRIKASTAIRIRGKERKGLWEAWGEAWWGSRREKGVLFLIFRLKRRYDGFRGKNGLGFGKGSIRHWFVSSNGYQSLYHHFLWFNTYLYCLIRLSRTKVTILTFDKLKYNKDYALSRLKLEGEVNKPIKTKI